MSAVFVLEDPQVRELLLQGKVGVIPTDTIYGLVADAANPQAVSRAYALKSREHKPGTIIAASIDQLAHLGVNEAGLEAVAHHWPNPISIVIDANNEISYLHQGVGSLAVRIPNNKALLDLLQHTGPLVTTSANSPGDIPANTVSEAQRYFADTVDFYVDGGDLAGRPPSTVARYADGKLTVLRQGAFKLDS